LAKAYLLLGSNKGNSAEIFEKACKEINKEVGNIVQSSSLYRTEPWGVTDQADYLNQLIIIDTNYEPVELLKLLLQLEKDLGRERIIKWGPRTIDIDILYFEKEIVVRPELKIPHPELQNRKFALIPLVELDPDFIHPVFNISNREMLKRCKDKLQVNKL
jgi:2-amino-4-hydroxy-6-hydroxymethyldihydropteridine diphosphokinase